MSSKIEETPRARGRPKSDNPASVTLPRVRVTPEQLERYKQSALDSDKSFSEWIREALDKASANAARF